MQTNNRCPARTIVGSLQTSSALGRYLGVVVLLLVLSSCVSSTPGAYWLSRREMSTLGVGLHLAYGEPGIALPSITLSAQVSLTDQVNTGFTFSGIPIFLNNVEPFIAYSPTINERTRLVTYLVVPFYFGLRNEAGMDYIFRPTFSIGVNGNYEYELGKTISTGIKFDPRLVSMNLDSTNVDFMDPRSYGANLSLASVDSRGVFVNQVQYAYPSMLQYSLTYQLFLRRYLLREY